MCLWVMNNYSDFKYLLCFCLYYNTFPAVKFIKMEGERPQIWPNFFFLKNFLGSKEMQQCI